MTAVTRRPGRVGESARRIDGVPKTTGEYVYGGDLSAPWMLWGVTLRSPHAAARIRSIDVSEAIRAPGVHAVLTAADVPGRPTFGLEIADQPVLARDEVRYEGEPVALVAADRLDRARAALRLIRVEYEPLEPLVDMELALDPNARRLHDFGNVLRHVHIARGDLDAAEADVWVSGFYETGDAGSGAARAGRRAGGARRQTAASTSSSRPSGCTSTDSRSHRVSACRRSSCA